MGKFGLFRKLSHQPTPCARAGCHRPQSFRSTFCVYHRQEPKSTAGIVITTAPTTTANVVAVATTVEPVNEPSKDEVVPMMQHTHKLPCSVWLHTDDLVDTARPPLGDCEVESIAKQYEALCAQMNHRDRRARADQQLLRISKTSLFASKRRLLQSEDLVVATAVDYVKHDAVTQKADLRFL